MFSGQETPAEGEPGQKRRGAAVEAKVPRVQFHGASRGQTEGFGFVVKTTENETSGDHASRARPKPRSHDRNTHSHHSGLGGLLSLGGGSRQLRATGSVVAPPAAVDLVAAVEAEPNTIPGTHSTRYCDRSGSDLGFQRARALVECGRQPYESGCPRLCLPSPGFAILLRGAFPTSIFMNRRIRNRTYGGVVGGR